MWYGVDDGEEDDDDDDYEGWDGAPILDGALRREDSHQPSLLEVFVKWVDEAVAVMTSWSAKNWKLDADLTDADGNRSNDRAEGEGDEGLDMDGELGWKEDDIESHVNPDLFPLLRLVRKYLKKVQRALKDMWSSVEAGGERDLEEDIAVLHTAALEAKDELAFKYSRLTFKIRQQQQFSPQDFQGIGARRRALIMETFWTLFWWWKAAVAVGGLALAGLGVFVLGAWFLRGARSAAGFWAEAKGLVSALLARVISSKIYGHLFPHERTLTRTLVSVTAICCVFSFPFFVLCCWKLFRLFLQLTNEPDDADTSAATPTPVHAQPQVVKSEHLHVHQEERVEHLSVPLLQFTSITSESSIKVQDSCSTMMSPGRSTVIGCLICAPQTPTPQTAEEDLNLPAHAFVTSATQMWDTIVAACDWIQKATTDARTGGLIGEMINSGRPGEGKSAFDAAMSQCERHCASLIASYADLKEATEYKKEQYRLTKIYSDLSLYDLATAHEHFDGAGSAYGDFDEGGHGDMDGMGDDVYRGGGGGSSHDQDSADGPHGYERDSHGHGHGHERRHGHHRGGNGDFFDDDEGTTMHEDDWRQATFEDMEDVLREID